MSKRIDWGRQRWCAVLMLFFAVFAYMGLRVVTGPVHDYLTAADSPGWPLASGMVVASTIDPRPDAPPRAVIHYRYEVAGLVFVGTRVSFDRSPAPPNTIAKYRVGAPVAVFYSPDNPGFAVLEPGRKPFAGGTRFGLGLLFALVGAAGVFVFARAMLPQEDEFGFPI